MSEKITCDVIRDLMILCEEELCSEDSKRLVLNHIAECEECKKIYEMIKAPMPETKLIEEKEAEMEHQAVKAFKKIKKKMTFEAMMKFGVCMLVLLMLHALWVYKLEERVNVIPSSEIEVTEIYQLENGDYYATLECEGNFAWDYCEVVYLPEDGNRFTSEEFCYKLNFQRPFFWEWNKVFYNDEISIYFPKVDYAFGKHYPNKECTSIQYVTGNGKEELIIWKEGQSVQKAPEEIERRVEAQIEQYSLGYTIQHAREIEDK